MSDNNKSEYPENTATHFTNRLPHMFSINPNSKICLSEISFYQHVNLGHLDPPTIEIFDFSFYKFNKADPPQKSYGRWYSETIDLNAFSTPPQLCGALNMVIYKNISRLRKIKPTIFSYDEDMKRVWIDIPEKYNILVLLKGSILALLGIEKFDTESSTQFVALGRSKRKINYKGDDGKLKFFDRKLCDQRYRVSEKGLTYCRLPPQLITLESLLVHCNVIKPSAISNRFHTILRLIPLKRKKDGLYVTYSFAGDRKYFDFSKTTFSEITIKITDRELRPVYLTGNTTVELHIMKK